MSTKTKIAVILGATALGFVAVKGFRMWRARRAS